MGVLLLGSSVVKIAFPAESAALLVSKEIIYVLAAVEFLVASCLLLKPTSGLVQMISTGMVLSMAAFIVALRLVGLPASACGCFGRVRNRLGFPLHFVVLGFMLGLMSFGRHSARRFT